MVGEVSLAWLPCGGGGPPTGVAPRGFLRSQGSSPAVRSEGPQSSEGFTNSCASCGGFIQPGKAPGRDPDSWSWQGLWGVIIGTGAETGWPTNDWVLPPAHKPLAGWEVSTCSCH